MDPITSEQTAIIRALIPDTEAVFDGDTMFTDTEIGYYYLAGSGNMLRAAGLACMAIGSSEAIISKIIRTQDLQTNGATLQDSFTNKAKVLFARADKEDDLADSSYFQIIDFGWAGDRPELTEWYNPLDENGFARGGFGN